MLSNGFSETQLGPLPSEWGIVELRDVATLTMGQSPPSSTYNSEGLGLPFLQGKAEFGNIYPNPIKWCSQPLKLAKSGSILISVRAPVGDVNVARDKYCIGRGLASIDGNEILDNSFLFFQLTYAKKRLEDRGTGSTFKSINKGVLQEFSIPLPPLPEQRAIAHVLSSVRRAIEATEQVIDAAKELKRSMMKHLFTYGPVPVDRADQVELKETEIGEVPERWSVSYLQDCATKQKYAFVDGPFGSNLKRIHYRTKGILVIQSQFFTQGGFTITNPVYVTEEKADELLRSNVKPGDIVIAKIGANFGACSIVPSYINRAVLSGNTMKITIDESVADKRYIFQYLNYYKQTRMIAGILSTHTAQPALSLSRMRKLFFPLPPLEEQRRSADILDDIDRKIWTETQQKTALEALFNSLLHHLMTGKVRVNTLIPNPSPSQGEGSETKSPSASDIPSRREQSLSPWGRG